MAYGDSMSYLPAMSHLLGEVEQPTQNNALMAPNFGGSPEQMQSMLQSPHVQQMLQRWGINFNPNQVRQSPFFQNSFMNQHPMLGKGLTGAMANVAATPEAPLVSGAGSGMSRAMQGMMGGPEMLRQYQMRQMMSPMQGIGMQMPEAEFQRKQQLLDLLTKMEQDRQQQSHAALQAHVQQPIKTPYGIIQPGALVDPNLAGQQQHVGSQSPFELFKGQGNQRFPEQQQQTFQPYDPNMIAQQTTAQHPERGAQGNLANAKANEQTQETNKGMPGAKVGAENALANQRNQAGRLAGSRAQDINTYGGPGRRGAQKNAGDINRKYDQEYQKIGRDVMAINQDSKKTPEQKQQGQQDANIRFKRLEEDRQRDLANLERSGVPANTPPSNMMAPNTGAPRQAPQQQVAPPAPQNAQAPPRPSNVPPDYMYNKNGPKGEGWYRPQPQQSSGTAAQ